MNFESPHIEDDSHTFQMTAMVDVVFILLAFFVLSAQFRQMERDFTMGYTEATLAKGVEKGDLPSEIQIQLSRTETGVAIQVAQAILRENDFDGIAAKLSEINMPAIQVRILADSTLRVGQVARAIDAVLASPMKKVSVSKLTAEKPGKATPLISVKTGT